MNKIAEDYVDCSMCQFKIHSDTKSTVTPDT